MIHPESELYSTHHKKNRGKDYSIWRVERGELFKDWIGKGKEILDLGCRDGSLTRFFAKGNSVLGLDVDPSALKKASKIKGVDTKLVNLNGDWGQDKVFDVVVAGEVMEHVYFPSRFLKKVKKSLKKGGQFMGSVPNAFSIKNRFRLLFGNKEGTSLEDPTHINHFHYMELKDLLEHHFKKVEILPLVKGWKGLARLSPNLFSHSLVWRCRK